MLGGHGRAFSAAGVFCDDQRNLEGAGSMSKTCSTRAIGWASADGNNNLSAGSAVRAAGTPAVRGNGRMSLALLWSR